MASRQEILESMRFDLRKIDELLSNMIEINQKSKEILQWLELSIREMSLEEREFENADVEDELPLGFEKATHLESDESMGDEESSESEIGLMSESHSVLVSTGYRSPSRCRPSFKVTSNSNRKFQSASGARSIYIQNSRVAGREKEIKEGKTSSTPTVRLIVNEREPLVGINNNQGNDSLKLWGDSKGRIQQYFLLKGVVFNSVLQLLICLQDLGNQNMVVMQSGFEDDQQGERGLISMHLELMRLLDCAFKVFDKTTGLCWMAQMVTALRPLPQFGSVMLVGIVFDKMPQNNSATLNDIFGGYAPYGQLRETLYLCHLSLMEDDVGNWMTCGFHKVYGIKDFKWELASPGTTMQVMWRHMLAISTAFGILSRLVLD